MEGLKAVSISKQSAPASGVLQRKCSGCKKKENEKVRLQRTAVRSGPVGEVPPIVHEVLRSPGKPLDKATREFMETRFGYDFSGVRVHTDAKAAESARAVSALAYTVGQNIVFDDFKYAQETQDLHRLVAHELVHVIQQGSSSAENVNRICPDDDAYEKEAEKLSDLVITNPGLLQNSGMHSLGSCDSMLSAYRNKGNRGKKTPHFGGADDNNMKEEEFHYSSDKDSKPWIEKIEVNFDGTDQFSHNGVVTKVPTGTLSATYHNDPTKSKTFHTKVVGGSTNIGLTDRGVFNVVKIEGEGYNSGGTYSKDGNANMHLAVKFHQTGEAIHFGSLKEGSHACVHVGNWGNMRKINYHSVELYTKVIINYDESVRTELCCDRFKYRRHVPNPCNNISPKKCRAGQRHACSIDGNIPTGIPADVRASISMNDDFLESQPINGALLFNMNCPLGQVCVSGNCQPPKILPKKNIEMQFNKDAPQWWYDSASSFKVSLTQEGHAAFNELVAKMESQPTLRVQLEGHASSDRPANDEGYNRRLTDRRARLIASELEKRGIPRSRLDNPSDESSPSGCEEIDKESTRGLLSCGDEGAKAPPDPSDRKVVASLFQ